MILNNLRPGQNGIKVVPFTDAFCWSFDLTKVCSWEWTKKYLKMHFDTDFSLYDWSAIPSNIDISHAHMIREAYSHDDVIKWKHFPRYWPFVQGIHWSPVNFPHKGQWPRALMFSLICVWINGWVNSHEAGYLRCYGVHYDITVMSEGYNHESCRSHRFREFLLLYEEIMQNQYNACNRKIGTKTDH